MTAKRETTGADISAPAHILAALGFYLSQSFERTRFEGCDGTFIEKKEEWTRIAEFANLDELCIDNTAENGGM